MSGIVFVAWKMDGINLGTLEEEMELKPKEKAAWRPKSSLVLMCVCVEEIVVCAWKEEAE